MRSLLATLACIAGLFAVYVFGTGVLNGPHAPGTRAFWDATLAPFTEMGVTSLAVLCGGLAAFVLSLILSPGFSRASGEVTWAGVLELGLAFNAILAAGLLGVVLGFRANLSAPATGAVAAVAGLECLVGLVLGFVLLFLKHRNNKVFVPCFSLNVLDAAALAVVVALGVTG